MREPLTRDPKLPDVSLFDGNKVHYSAFVASIGNFFSAQPNTYRTDSQRISYVISRLTGTAMDWATCVIENPEIEANAAILADWNVFMHAFSKFSDPFAKKNATARLLSLVQGKSQSVLNYWTKFSELLYRSEISPDSARPLFERGLKYDLRDRMADKEYPEDLDQFVGLANYKGYATTDNWLSIFLKDRS
jgi:hypothetical protein